MRVTRAYECICSWPNCLPSEHPCENCGVVPHLVLVVKPDDKEEAGRIAVALASVVPKEHADD